MSTSNNLFLVRCSAVKDFAPLMMATMILGCSSVQQPMVSVSGIPVKSNHVCIDVNDVVPSGDLLRAIEVSLREEGVAITLYSRGTERNECKTTLEYSVHSQNIPDSNAAESAEYWDSIDFSVLQGQVVVAIGRFKANGLDGRAVPFEDLESMVHALIRPIPAVISSRSRRSEGWTGN